MGFYIRKAISFGPLRFNLSKSGIGVSVGVKGARIGTGPGGAYVHMGRHGLYYRQRLGTEHFSSIPRAIHPPEAYPEPAAFPDVTELVDSSSEEVLSQLNARLSQTSHAPLILALAIFAVVLAAFLSGILAVCIGFVGLGLTWLFHNGDKHKRTSEFFYHLADDAAVQFTSLQVAFETLAKSHRIWLVKQEQSTWDQKRNAGASRIISRSPVSVGTGEPPWIKTNVSVWRINLGAVALYFFPDRVLAWRKRSWGTQSYPLRSKSTRFPSPIISAQRWRTLRKW